MNKTKIRQLLTATALTAAATLAQAGTMSLDQSAFTLQSTGAFSIPTLLTLGDRQLVNLQLTGWSADAADLQFSSLTLQKGNQTFVFDHQSQLTSLGAALLDEEQRGAGRSKWTAYLQSYELTPVVLDAGEWTVTVNGSDEHLKFFSGFKPGGSRDRRARAGVAGTGVAGHGRGSAGAPSQVVGGLICSTKTSAP